MPFGMDVQDLRIFARVTRVQNLSAVGSEFELSAGTISKRLQSLEAELGLRLFDRTTRAISITAEGAKLLDDIERILRQLDEAVASVTAHVERPRGRLRVLAPTGLARGFLAPAICTFMQAYDEIDVQLDLTDRPTSIAESGYDVAIRTGALEDSSLVAKRLAADPCVLVAAPSYLARCGEPERPEDLSRHNCLLPTDGQHWNMENGGEQVDVKVSGRLRSDNTDVLRHAALEGLGIARLSEARVADDLRHGLLHRVLADWETGAEAAIWAVYPSSRHVLPKVRVFLEFLSLWCQDCRQAGATAPKRAGPASGLEDLLGRLQRAPARAGVA
jgi:DNA-binding transcriptional LysR family regulator